MQLLIKNLSIAILVHYLIGETVQVIINSLDLCSCEQLLYQAECELFPSCKFSNNTCLSLACNEIGKQQSCLFNKNCAWYKNQCSDFQSCRYYNLTNATLCHQVNNECQYNPFTNECERYDKAFKKPCSQIIKKDECQYGSDGVCKYEDSHCSQLSFCENITSADISCLLAYPACYPTGQQCENRIGCKNAQWSDCWFASASIHDPNSYYLCQEANKPGQCEDWDPTNSTIQDCFFDSLGYFHWNGISCEACTGVKTAILLIANIIAILAL